MNQNNKILDQYIVLKTLGKGATSKVKLGLDQQSGQKVALKILKDSLDDYQKEQINSEMKMMLNLKHDNIIKLLSFSTGIYKKQNSQRQVAYLVYERAEGGELMDFLLITGKFSEPLARYYFNQLMLGLDFCHVNGVAHRDLKPDNLLLDKNFNLKIADFGYAAPFLGKDGQGKMKSQVGTLQYQAPEIIQGLPYRGKDVDIFSAGVILFTMVNRSFPFQQSASLNDYHYQLIANNQIDQYWQMRQGFGEKISQELMDLLTCMLQLDPLQRPSITEVLSHKWMKGPLPSPNYLQDKLTERKNQVREKQEQDRQIRQQERDQRMMNHRNDQGYRSLSDENPGEQQSIKLDSYEKVYEFNTEFFSSYPPQMIEDQFIKYLIQNNSEFKLDKKKYKLKFFDFADKDKKEQEQIKTEICMRIFEVNEYLNCVQFKMINGIKEDFCKLFTYYEEQILAFANDQFLQ